MSAVSQRLMEIINFLKAERFIHNARDFAGQIGVQPSYVSEGINGKRAITPAFAGRIELKFPLLREGWLMTGEGKMLKDKSEDAPTPTPAIVWDETARHIGIPIYDIDFACSFVEMYNDFSSNPIGWLSLPPFNDPEKYAVVRAVGDSMSPEIGHGALIILGRQPLPVDRIFYGDIYGIETIDDIRSIKRVVRAEDKHKVRLVPSNPAYGDYQDYSVDAIRRVYKVYHVLNQKSY